MDQDVRARPNSSKYTCRDLGLPVELLFHIQIKIYKREMGSETTTITEIPKINLSGLELSELQSEAWVAARSKVMEAIDTVGFFSVAFDGVSDEFLDELFGSVANSLFSAPLELKMKLISPDKPFRGYIPSGPGYKLENLNITDPQRPESVRAFTDHLLPQGNPTICDALTTYSSKLYKLELMVKRMILESLGIEEHFNSLLEYSNQYGLNIIKYGDHPENSIAMKSHRDPHFLTILYQHQHQGLEILAKSGDWLYPSPKTSIIMPSESLEAYSNGRIKACLHRVRLHKKLMKETRCSLSFVSQFRDGFMIEIPKELVNDEHPKLYKPFENISYLFFRGSEEGAKAKYTIKAYCGVNGDEIED